MIVVRAFDVRPAGCASLYQRSLLRREPLDALAAFVSLTARALGRCARACLWRRRMTDTPEFPPEVVEAVRRYMGARAGG
jgi:hypothetical protein